MFFLNGPQQQSLLLQPETGMGYQLVELTTPAGRRAVGVAYNAELVLEADEPNRALLFGAFAKGLSVHARGAPVRAVRLLPRDAVEYRALLVGEPRTPYAARGVAATDAPVAVTKAGEVFQRFSACAHDHRIRADGSLAPGSFATTAQDAGAARAAKEILARYALPHPGPAAFGFTIKPVAATLVQYGTAQPGYHQSGGGVEVIFTEGTTPHTVTGPEKFPARPPAPL